MAKPSIPPEEAPEKTSQDEQHDEKKHKGKPKCGIIMPISELPGYTTSHWIEVKRIIQAAAKAADFEAEVVSVREDVGIIHASIINNLFKNPMVVCDVSGKNPNVMLELGLRLASKLPVIIIKDDSTSYSFDTSPIEHLEYPKDLRYFDIILFQENLAKRIKQTFEASQKEDYKTFLDHFGTYSIDSVEDKTIGVADIILKMNARLERIEQNQIAREPSSHTLISTPTIFSKASAAAMDAAYESMMATIKDRMIAVGVFTTHKNSALTPQQVFESLEPEFYQEMCGIYGERMIVRAIRQAFIDVNK